MNNTKVTLIVCDGMGLSSELTGNAIAQTPTPTFDYLLTNYPSMRLLAAGTEVGLDMGEPGNSEVGHLTIGTGQVMPQAFQIINGAIKSESYKSNKAFLQAIERVKRQPTQTLHIVGLVSSGGVHGHIDHIIALLVLAKEKGVERVAIHAITDGRDSPSKVAIDDLQKIVPYLKQFTFGVVATIGGRFWAMDRDHNMDRTKRFIDALAGKASYTAYTHDDAIAGAYERGENDENIAPTVIVDSSKKPIAPIQDNDVIIFTNYRPDRIRQLVTEIILASKSYMIVTMTDYFLGDVPISASVAVMNAYPLPRPEGTLSSVLSEHHKTQLHIAETEKYAHITYFFNGHEEHKKPLEEWVLIPSVKVTSFDEAPQMSAAAIASSWLLSKQQHPSDFSTLNFANMDMLGHTGNYEATCRAVAIVDAQIKIIVDAIEQTDEWLILTADHGNAEQMISPASGEIDKEHTTNPVPLVVLHSSLKRKRQMDKRQLAVMSQVGILADVAPTILEIMGIAKPRQMVGTSLLSQLIKN